MDFGASTNHFLYIFSETPAGESFFFCVETYFWTNPSFWKLAETVNAMTGNQYLRQNLFLLVVTDFLVSANHFVPLSHILFKESFIPISENVFSSPKE